MNTKVISAICLLAAAAQCWTAPAAAANPELIDFSCPTSADDEPTIFPEGTEQLPMQGVIWLAEHSHNYQLTFTPHFDARQGYVGDILIIGRKYTRDPITQQKTYAFDKDEFHQAIVEFPFAFCRSHKAPFQKRGNQTIGQLTIDDDSGATRSSRIRMNYLSTCRSPPLCDKQGLGASFEEQTGNVTTIEFGKGILNQDLRILPR